MKKMIQAGVFKAQCLRIMDEVKKSKNPITITKHKVPIVKIVPMDDQKQKIFGKMKGSGRVLGEIISTDEAWDADS